MPAGTGRSESTSKVGADTLAWSLQGTAVLVLPGDRPDDGDPKKAIVDARARARADRAPEPVAVVRDEHRSPSAVLVPARPTPSHIELVAARAEHVGHGVQHGADLGVAVAGVLHRLSVEP